VATITAPHSSFRSPSDPVTPTVKLPASPSHEVTWCARSTSARGFESTRSAMRCIAGSASSMCGVSPA
jgi:hypothetical protein